MSSFSSAVFFGAIMLKIFSAASAASFLRQVLNCSSVSFSACSVAENLTPFLFVSTRRRFSAKHCWNEQASEPLASSFCFHWR